MSNLLKQKHVLTSLRAKLEGKKERECWGCKGFRHLAQNCRNKKGKEKRETAPQNKFEVLSSRVMQCDVKKRMIRKQETVKVEYFKCREKRHKCRECPLWKKRKEVASGRRGGACGHATKSAAKRIEEESGACPTMKSTGALWRGHSR